MEQGNRFYEVCGLQTDSTAACWAHGNVVGGEPPVPLPSALRFVGLARGHGFTCGRTAVGELYCWGSLILGPNGFAPVLALSHAESVGAMFDWLQVLPDLTQWFTFDFLMPGAHLQPAPLGLQGLALLRYGKNKLGCLQSRDHQVYCLEGLFTGSTALSASRYGPVPPPRRFDPAGAQPGYP